jgi:hypothetical protein
MTQLNNLLKKKRPRRNADHLSKFSVAPAQAGA